MNKFYWFYLEVFVYTRFTGDKCLLYNSLNNTRMEVDDKKVLDFLYKLLSKENSMVIGLTDEELEPEIIKFVTEIEGYYMGGLVESTYSKILPKQAVPKITAEIISEDLSKLIPTINNENARHGSPRVKRVLFISRGRGYGHVMCDILTINELRKIEPAFEVQIASYGHGYSALKSLGYTAINLELNMDEEMNAQGIIKFGSIIKETAPDLIVAHETFFVPPIARIFNIPTILFTHWFYESINPKHPLALYVRSADQIIFNDVAPLHQIPEDFNVPVSFVGPIIREWDYSIKDKASLRKTLGIDDDAKVILVTTGGGHIERAHIFEMVISVFEKINIENSRLIILAGEIRQELLNKYEKEQRIIFLDYAWQIEKLFIMSDLVVCAGTFTTLWELAFLGIPSISTPDQNNMIDIAHVRKMVKLNVTSAIEKAELTIENLYDKMLPILTSKDVWNEMSNACQNIGKPRGQKLAASMIRNYLKSINN